MSLPLPNSSVINRYLQSHFKRRSPYQRNHLCKWQATCSPHPLSCNPHTSCHHPLSGLQRCPPPANCPKLCHIRKLNLRFLPCHKVLLHHIQLCYVSSLLMSQSSSKFPLFLKPSKETVQGSPWTSFLPAPPSVYILPTQVLLLLPRPTAWNRHFLPYLTA